MTQMCPCLACARNGQQGGISIDARMHVTRDEVTPPPRKAKALAPAPAVTLTRQAVAAMIKAERETMVESIGLALGEAVRQLRGELAGLQQRIAEVEQQCEARKFVGLWQGDGEYRSGNQVLCDGGTWLCHRDHTTAKPGTSSDWQLVKKSAPPPPRVTRSDVNGSGGGLRRNSA